MANLQIKYYVVDEVYAAKLKAEPAYKDSSLEKLAAKERPATMFSGVTENIQDGLALVVDQPMVPGTPLVLDITVPKTPRPLRALAEVVSSDSKDGRVVDRTVTTYKVGLKIIAINKDDLIRIENYMIEEKIRGRSGGK